MANQHTSYNGPAGRAARGGAPYNHRTGGFEEAEINFKRLFLVIWRRKWLIVGLVVLFGVLAGIYAFMSTPIYQSNGEILIYQSRNSLSGLNLGGGGALSSLISGNYGIDLGTSLDNELEVLRSRKLSRNIADSLLKQRIMPNGRQYPVIFKSYPKDSMLTSRDTVALRLRGKLLFQKAPSGANVINVTYESPSAVASGRVVNVALNQFNKLSNRRKRSSVNSAATFLKHEKARIKDSLNVSENRLRRFMNEHQLVQVDAQTKQLVQQMATLEAARQEAKAKLESVNSGIGQYKSELNSVKPGLAEQYAESIGPDISKLQYAKSELEVKKQQLLTNNPQITSSSPQIRSLDKKINSYKQRIKNLTQNLLNKNDRYLGFLGNAGDVAKNITNINQKLIELQVQQKQYQAKMQVTSAQLQKQQKFFNKLPDNIVALAKLKRDVKVNETLYETITKQYAQTSIQERSQFGLGQVIDHGYTPKKPAKPNKKLYVLIGFILGGMLGVGYILFDFAFVDQILGAEDMETMPVPLLAVVPKHRGAGKRKGRAEKVNSGSGTAVSDRLVAYHQPESDFSDAFRRLQNRLFYRPAERPSRLIAISSSAKADGKTTVCGNLGVTLAQAGNNVLLIDTDFQNPALYKLFNLENAPGITDIIANNASLQDGIRETTVPGLRMIPAGNRASYTTAVTRNEDFAALLQELSDQFDYILVDTSPAGKVADTVPVLAQADGTILVAKFGKTGKVEISKICDDLQTLDINVLGTVLTNYKYDTSNDLFETLTFKSKDYNNR